MGDRCARRNQSTKTERNQGSDEAKQTTDGACADRDLFSRLPNRLMGDPEALSVVARRLNAVAEIPHKLRLMRDTTIQSSYSNDTTSLNSLIWASFWALNKRLIELQTTSHSEFVQSWSKGLLEIDVDRSKALQIANSKMLPMRYRAAHIFWGWVWIISIPAAFAVMYFYDWWMGLLLLVFLTPTLSRSTKKSAMQFMIDHSLESPEFYQFAVSEGVVRVRPKP